MREQAEAKLRTVEEAGVNRCAGVCVERWVVAFLVKNAASLLNLILKVWEPGFGSSTVLLVPFAVCRFPDSAVASASARLGRAVQGVPGPGA